VERRPGGGGGGGGGRRAPDLAGHRRAAHAVLAAGAGAELVHDFMVRTSSPPAALVPAVRSAIASLDPALPPGRFRTLDEVVEGSLERERCLLRLLAGFAAVALLLAAVGVYGVMSYAVVERVPEVGVRLAVGAGPDDIVRLMMRDGLALGLLGVGIGVVGAGAGAGALRGRPFAGAPRDPARPAAALLAVP